MKVKLKEGALMPRKGRPGDAGYDIFLTEAVEVDPHTVAIVPTGVCVQLPRGYAGLLAIRSSIAKTGLILQNPLIDENYRGEIHMILANFTDRQFRFERSERICSLYAFKPYGGELEQVEELDPSDRGSAWAGSSGK